MEASFKIVERGNPLATLESGESITVQPGRQTQVSRDKVGDQDRASTAPSQLPKDKEDNYTVSHLRDIVVGKGLASVFRGTHSEFGDVVVKVIRKRKQPVSASYIAQLARDWQNEERFLRKVDHVRCQA